MLTVAATFDNPQQPGDFAQAYFPDQLMAGGAAVVSQPAILASGTLPRGSVLGAQTAFSIVATPKAGGNTGNGTVGSYVSEPGRRFGNFIVTFTGATTYTVTDPEGDALGNGTTGVAFVGTPAGGTAEIGFTITAGSTPFVAGDGFTLNQEEATGNYVLSVKTAGDGSQNPVAILADYADASGGPVRCGVYVFGEFNQNALSYDNSWTLPALVAAMRPYGLFAKFAVSAADPVQP